jgi:hypothetical protein
MVRFEDGPAAGQTLALHRAPTYLRAVRGAKGWDALDQLDDTPAADELIVVYRLAEKPSQYHLLCGRGKRGNASGWYWNAVYRVVSPQPDDAVLRSNEEWQRWAQAQPLPSWVEEMTKR